MTYEEIVAGLRALSESDCDYNNMSMQGPENLRRLADAVQQLLEPKRIMPEMFAVMERLPSSDLGSPGPLVHIIERMQLAR